MSQVRKYLNDHELLALSKNKILVEGLQGLVKLDRSVALSEGVKLRIGSVITGNSIIGPSSDLGLAGGAIIESSQLGQDAAVTGGGKIFYSVAGPHLRNYGSQLRHSKVGANFVIRSMAETKNLVSGNNCKLKMFSRAYHSEIGDNNTIGSHSLVAGSQMGDGNLIGDYSSIENCQIGDKVKIGNYVHVRGSSSESSTVIEDNCQLGDHVVVHAGTRLFSGTKIPDYALVFTRNGKTVMSVIDMDETLENS